MLEIIQIPVFDDNFIYILRDHKKELTAAIDPGDPQATIDFLTSKNWHLDFIFNTHHHWDHVDGNIALKEKYNCEIYCSDFDISRIPGSPCGLKENQILPIGEGIVIDTPGHTNGHISFYFKAENALFCGDTLFSLGCGRLLGGSAQQLHESLQLIKKLPENTNVYCTHEYTLANTKFAISLDPKNIDLQKFEQKIIKLLSDKLSSIPCTLAQELELNPFLLAKNIGDFTALRKAKDIFKA